MPKYRKPCKKINCFPKSHAHWCDASIFPGDLHTIDCQGKPKFPTPTPNSSKNKESELNEQITKISMEFVEMVFKMMESKRIKKTFWVSKTSEKIHKLLIQQRREIRSILKAEIPKGAKDASVWVSDVLKLLK
jgi:hypothetical protein